MISANSRGKLNEGGFRFYRIYGIVFCFDRGYPSNVLGCSWIFCLLVGLCGSADVDDFLVKPKLFPRDVYENTIAYCRLPDDVRSREG